MCNAELYEKAAEQKGEAEVDVLTLYVGQGALTGIRVGNEGIIVDAHMPECDDVTPDEIKQTLLTYFRGMIVRGFLLTGFDCGSRSLGRCGMDTLPVQSRLGHVPKVLQGHRLCWRCVRRDQ